MNKLILNNNGGSGKDLLQERLHALDKLREAEEAVQKITVHGRDYQTNKQPNLDRDADYNEKIGILAALQRARATITESARTINQQMKG